jgi:hypothetical protein
VTLEGLLFVGLIAGLMLNWPVAVILWWAALHPPRIRALMVMAVSATLIAVGLTVYVLAVLNSAAGYIVPRESAQVALRAVLLGLALFPIWFLWLYLTRRFDDGESS